jgi:DNA-binding response OmpR family regulator
MKILIAEDDRDLARLAETILRASGHAVIKAADASQIQPSAQREKPDLILLDINMPGGKGNDILVKLKRSSLTSSIQVIVISGEAGPQIRALVMQEGAEGFLPKPWIPETFIQDLQKLAPSLPW